MDGDFWHSLYHLEWIFLGQEEYNKFGIVRILLYLISIYIAVYFFIWKTQTDTRYLALIVGFSLKLYCDMFKGGSLCR
jgi:hypothetical protein